MSKNDKKWDEIKGCTKLKTFIKAIVTLLNGKAKTVRMTIKVK